MSPRLFPATCLIVLFLLLGIHPLAAQGIDGTLRGDARDPSGAILPGVTVTAIHAETGEARSQVTTSAGTFNLPNLLVGPYTVTAELSGFKKYSHPGVQVTASQVTEVHLHLELGAPTDTVEVVAGAELVKTSTSDLGGTFDAEVITRIPARPTFSTLPAEDAVLNLAILESGVSSQPGGVAGEGGAIGGNRPHNNNFVLDGVDNNLVLSTGHSQPVIDEGVANFTLLTNQFAAEYGHSTGGQFIITTKSGTNRIHGTARYAVNNRNLNALDNIDKAAIARGDLQSKPRFDWNQAGGSLGGPIIPDKWFYYGAYEYKTLGQAATPGAVTLVPTAAGFATLDQLATSAGTGVSRTVVDILKNSLPTASLRSRTVNVTRTDTGTVVPVELGIVTPAAPSFFTQHDYILNSDYQSSARNRISARHLWSRARQPDIPPLPLPQFLGSRARDAWSVTLSDVFTTARWVNEARAGYRRFVQAVSLPSGLTKPATLDTFPNFSIGGISLAFGPGLQSPQSYVINTYQLVDQVTIMSGPHILKTGVDYRWWITPLNFLQLERGSYTYDGLDAFVKDVLPNSANAGSGLRGVGTGVFAGNQNAVYAFIQDDWKIHPRLTLNLGVRYEYTSNPRDTALQARNAIASVPGVAEFREPAVARNNWAPRLGLAWDPAGDGRTAVRAGFGVSYDVVFQNLITLRLPPQFQQLLDTNTLCTLPSRPAYCSTGRGFLAGGGLPSLPIPPTTAADARSLTGGLMVDQVPPTTITWSLSVQHGLWDDTVVEARYLGNHAYHLPVQMQRNGGIVPADSFFMPTYLNRSEVPATVPQTAPNLAAFIAARARALAGTGFLSAMTAFDPLGNSHYHALSLSLERRVSRGLYIKSGYTWSKTIDDATNLLNTSIVNPRRPEDFFDLGRDRGLSALDLPHKFTGVFLWDLPAPGRNGVARALLGGWQLGPNYVAESGQPVTPQSFADANGNFDTATDRTILNPNGRPRTGTDVSFVCRTPATGATFVGPSAAACGGNPNVVGYVANDPTARHVRAQQGTRANAGRNIERSAGLNNWNLVVLKSTPVNEDVTLEFKAEIQNVLNHPQPILGSGSVFLSVDNAVSSALVDPRDPNFLKPGEIFSTGNRSIILGLKLNF